MIGPSRPPIDSADQGLDNDPIPIAGPSRLPELGQNIGPTLPPHLQAMRTSGDDDGADDDERPPSDDEDDDYGPALPPHLQKTSTSIQGPSMPQSFAGHGRRSSSDSESSDEDVGPALPPDRLPNTTLTAAEEFRLREKERLDEEERKRKEAASKGKREEWMMVPPTGFDFASRSAAADPGKITKRGFNQNTRRGGAAADQGQAQDMSLWTETPEERARRLDDELMGKRKRKENATKQETPDERRARKLREQRDSEMRAQVQSANVSAQRRHYGTD